MLAAITFAMIMAAAARPEPTPCRADAPAGSQCALVRVRESDHGDRMLSLSVMVLTASGPDKRPDPIFILQGGPGQAATRLASFYDAAFAELRTARDIYLVDIRGTGDSAPLNCAIDTSISGGDLFAKDQLSACRRSHEGVDLSAYTSIHVVDDLETVRRAFGLGPVNLYGTSYGTRIAMDWARLHPDAVRTMTLKGVTPPQMLHPNAMGDDAQAVWNLYVERCGSDAACNTAFPSPEGLLGRTRAHVAAAFRAEGGPLSPGLFGELLRNELYTPESASSLFLRLRASANGDLTEWRTKAGRMGQAVSGALSVGLYLSVACAENIPFIDLDRARLDAIGTFAGAYRVEQQVRACAIWDVPAAATETIAPVRSSVPALMISGALDPVTPPGNGEAAAQGMSGARTVVLAANGHPMGAKAGCVQAMMAQLMDTSDAARVDATCAAQGELPPFRLE